MINVNHVDEDVKNATVSKDLVDSIYIGQPQDVAFAKKYGYPVHFGSFTDVNIWNRALTIDEMINWTNCRYIDNLNSKPDLDHRLKSTAIAKDLDLWL